MSYYSYNSYDSYDSESNDKIDVKGKILNEKYLIITKLGCGAFATVWLSYDIKNKSFYAIKIQNADSSDEGMEEVSIYKKINNSDCVYLNNMVDDFKLMTDFGFNICMVFELMAGSVYDLIKCNEFKNGLPLNMVKKIIKQLLLSLESLHRLGYIHTDVKPENMLIVGVSKKIASIIEEFKQLNFESIVRKNIPKKKRRNKKNVNMDSVYEKAGIEIISKLETLNEYERHYNGLNEDSKNNSDVSRERIDDDIKVICSDTNTNNVIKEDDKELECPIDSKYLRDIQIKLSDFGTCVSNDDTYSFSIQTRHYRAPEVILNYPYNYKCDVWSIGCTIFELVTGKTLFKPKSDGCLTTDGQHLYEMQCYFGRIPKQMIDNSDKKKLFFTKDGLIKGINKIEYNSLIEDSINDTILKNLLYGIFKFDVDKRFSFEQCLNHKWFNL